jgi:hypothetical protein
MKGTLRLIRENGQKEEYRFVVSPDPVTKRKRISFFSWVPESKWSYGIEPGYWRPAGHCRPGEKSIRKLFNVHPVFEEISPIKSLTFSNL